MTWIKKKAFSYTRKLYKVSQSDYYHIYKVISSFVSTEQYASHGQWRDCGRSVGALTNSETKHKLTSISAQLEMGFLKVWGCNSWKSECVVTYGSDFHLSVQMWGWLTLVFLPLSLAFPAAPHLYLSGFLVALSHFLCDCSFVVLYMHFVLFQALFVLCLIAVPEKVIRAFHPTHALM